MSRITRAEKWFGKKKKDLNEEERKEFEKLYSQEVKQYQVEYHKKWRKENPEKVKEYYTKYNNENKTLKEENDKLKQQIADLEAKLAESEKNYAELFCRNTELETLYSQKTALLNFYKDTDLVKENTELKQQLAEKDKEIIQLNNQLADYIESFDSRMMAFEDGCKEYYKSNEYKIDYAVEQLERLRELALNHIREIANDFSEDADERLNQRHTIHGCSTVITDINQLITEIKEGK